MLNFIDEIPNEVNGTSMNRLTMMSIQGMEPCSTSFSSDGRTVTEVYTDGTLVTTFSSDGNTITEVFTGNDGKVITKTTSFNTDGTISEVIS